MRYFDFALACTQIDRSGELKHHFEKASDKKNLTFSYPHYPKNQAFVERTQRTEDDELYAIHELPTDLCELNRLLANHVYTKTASAPVRPKMFAPFRIDSKL